ncbi:MAG TPA: LytTR family DNA-binding domain-containing protein [Flavobacteriales bacterium]|nr:LytTR family DNA-binding domain-containing protein [Flavobacteriales bacterium]
MKAVIIDDEERGRITIRNYIGTYANFITLAGEADSVETGIALIESLRPEIIFLDIQMGDGTGFDLIDQLKDRTFNVVFVTAFDHFALKAFQFNAMDYLLKPLDPDAFKRTTEKLRSSKIRNLETQIEALINFNKKPLKIALPSTDSIKYVNIADIIYLEADNNYTTFYIVNNEKIVVSKTIKDYEEMLEGMPFFRIHQSYIVNLRLINKYIKGEGGYVEMESGQTLEVARRRKESFLTALAAV